CFCIFFFFFSSRRRHTRSKRDWSSDVCSSDLPKIERTDEYIEVMDSWDSNPIKVTNLEKTIIDMLRKKNAMPGIVDEMINDYIDRDDTDIQKLVEYGTRFDVINQIEERMLPYVKSSKDEKSSRKKI